VAAIIGCVLVLIAWSNVIGTLIVPRALGGGLGHAMPASSIRFAPTAAEGPVDMRHPSASTNA
jgi:hypothetical protein